MRYFPQRHTNDMSDEPNVIRPSHVAAARLKVAIADRKGEEVAAWIRRLASQSLSPSATANARGRSHGQDRAREIKERIVAEAEHIAAEATDWNSSGDRLRELLAEWKTVPQAEQAAEVVLWERLSAARNAFTKRRKAHFAGLEEEREEVRVRKEQLVGEAESLATSTDWGPTAVRYRDLMQAWKDAGRASRETEEDLWARFKAAQDQFFTARAEALPEKETELREHAVAKEALLKQAQELLPITDLRSARAALRGIQEQWQQIGGVPRDSLDRLEDGLRKVEDAVRKAEDSR